MVKHKGVTLYLEEMFDELFVDTGIPILDNDKATKIVNSILIVELEFFGEGECITDPIELAIWLDSARRNRADSYIFKLYLTIRHLMFRGGFTGLRANVLETKRYLTHFTFT